MKIGDLYIISYGSKPLRIKIKYVDEKCVWWKEISFIPFALIERMDSISEWQSRLKIKIP